MGGVFGEVRQPVLGRLIGVGWPFGQQPACREAAVGGAGDAAAGGPDPDRDEVAGHGGVGVALGGLGALTPGHLPGGQASPGGLTRLSAGWWAGCMAAPAGLVDREGELSRLLGALGGDARLVLVVGDAGVGKTRLVEEGMARAALAGMVLVRGECLPLAGTLPLLPVADALGELGRLEGGRLLAAALDAAPEYVPAEVGRLLPGVGP